MMEGGREGERERGGGGGATMVIMMMIILYYARIMFEAQISLCVCLSLF